MAHLAARTRLGLAVEVQLRRRVADIIAPPVDIAADQVLHHRFGMVLGRAERQPADGAHQLFELAGVTGIDRPVAGIMRPRSELVDEELAPGRHEHLDGEETDDLELIGDVAGDRLRPDPKSTRLNSSHTIISYARLCLNKE